MLTDNVMTTDVAAKMIGKSLSVRSMSTVEPQMEEVLSLRESLVEPQIAGFGAQARAQVLFI